MCADLFSAVYTIGVKMKYTRAMARVLSFYVGLGHRGFPCTWCACWAALGWAVAILISGFMGPSGAAAGCFTFTRWLFYFFWLDHSSPSRGIWESGDSPWMTWNSSLRKQIQGNELPSLPNFMPPSLILSSEKSMCRAICCLILLQIFSWLVGSDRMRIMGVLQIGS